MKKRGRFGAKRVGKKNVVKRAVAKLNRTGGRFAVKRARRAASSLRPLLLGYDDLEEQVLESAGAAAHESHLDA